MTAVHAATAIPCEACGGRFPGGRQACEAAFNALSGAAQRAPLQAARHRLVVDAYCLQHPDPYCASAKSFAAHLVGLCWGLEHLGRPDGYAAIQRWLNGTPHLNKPTLPSRLGAVTLADVVITPVGAQRDARVTHWARTVWADFASHQPLARAWLAEAMARHQATASKRES